MSVFFIRSSYKVIFGHLFCPSPFFLVDGLPNVHLLTVHRQISWLLAPWAQAYVSILISHGNLWHVNWSEQDPKSVGQNVCTKLQRGESFTSKGDFATCFIMVINIHKWLVIRISPTFSPTCKISFFNFFLFLLLFSNVTVIQLNLQ